MTDPLEALRTYNQWINWAPVKKPDGKVDKLPISAATGEVVSAHDPANWMSAAEATSTGYNVGFVFTENDPFFFVDIDNQLLPDGKWSPIVSELFSLVGSAASAVSQSGRGIHIIGAGTAPEHPTERGIREAENRFDLYTSGRFAAMAPTGWQGDAGVDCTAGLHEICRRWLPPKQATAEGAEWSCEPDDGYTGYEDDDELIKRARATASANARFGGVTFDDLWTRNVDALSARWPVSDGREYNYSDADLSLAEHLAFWTGRNHERIESLMSQSALNRDKWEARPDYLRRTIINACAMQKRIYDVVKSDTPTNVAVTAQFLPIDKQCEYFSGCVYVASLHRVLTPNGMLLRPEAFKALYGGFVFPLDALNSKVTTNAFAAFTESQAFISPKVNDTYYDPHRQTGEVFDLEGIRYVNVFTPQYGECIEGDVTPFLRHAEKILPDAGDREILLSYLAACVQRVGEKFQWCVMLQGCEGNGKTLFYRALEYALGPRHCYVVRPKDLASNFNAWSENRLLLCVEEIRIAGRYEAANEIKPLITNERIAVEGKGTDQRSGRNIGNFILFSNYKDAVIKTASDRRYCVMYTAQQHVDDMTDVGMDAAYFKSLYEWLRSGGYANVAHYLANRPINIELQGRAPETTSTREAHTESLGPIESAILDAIEDNEPGMTGDAVFFATALQCARRYNSKILSASVSFVLTSMGYVRLDWGDFEPRLRAGNGRRSRVYGRRKSPCMSMSKDQILAHLFPQSS